MAPMDSPEFYKLLAQYKFAIAIENAVCDDYITEKFWRSIRLGNIPIVFGSPKIKDFLPANKSAIVVNDFKSLKDLASRIKHLDGNDAVYEQYLQYKADGITNKVLLKELEAREWGQGKQYGMFDAIQCRLCEKLHKLHKLAEQGKPLPVWRTKFDHFSCPKVKDFDSEGQYVLESKFYSGDWDFADYYAKGIVHFLEKGVNATRQDLHNYARELETNRQPKDEL